MCEQFKHALALPLLMLISGLCTSAQDVRLPAPVGWSKPKVSPPVLPGATFRFACTPNTVPQAPVIYSHSDIAAPDESIVLCGKGFVPTSGGNAKPRVLVWGASQSNPQGQLYEARVHLATDDQIIATMPERAPLLPSVVHTTLQYENAH